MNISDIRDEIKSLVNKEIMLKVSGSRAKTTMMKGIVNEVYSNIFTVLVDGVNKSFTYADVIDNRRRIYMQVTSVTVRKIEKEGSRMRGIASILLDDSFAVHDIRIIEGDNGLFIAMPSRKTATGGYRDIAHPINPDARKQLEDAIIAEYKKAE